MTEIETAPCNIHSVTDDHGAIIAELRQVLSDDFRIYTDHDCLRFLRGCNGNIEKAKKKLEAYHEWVHTLMDPISALNGLRFSPNILVYTPEHLANHPTGQGLIPVSHSGFDREGRPLYWEKTGAVQANFSVVKKVFSKEELLQFHIFSMIGLDMRYQHSTKQRGEPVESAIYISDMKGVTISLDVDSIWYMKQLIATDLAYYPERLHRMIIINSPWYFPALYNMFKPFIDARTREKIIILGADYESVLAEYADLSEIPLDYGGEDSNIVWGSSSFTNESGLSLSQIEDSQIQRLESKEFVFTTEEMIALHRAFTHSKYASEPFSIRKLELLEARMREEGVEIPPIEPLASLPPPPSDGNEEEDIAHQTLTNAAQTDGKAMSLHTAMKNKDALFAMPQLQVCDVLTTVIIGIENRVDHHVYVISVKFRNICEWTVKRRYSEFHQFMTKLKKVVPALNKEKYAMPPKVLFNKMADKVVAYRSPALDLFLKATIDNCKSYGTAEQDIIFSFLDAYDNIIRHVCVNVEERDKLMRAGMASVSEDGDGTVPPSFDGVGATDVNNSWQTSFAAAVITAWVIMLSMGMDGLAAV
mmetsp:Transcript_24780/g.41923  ORF Transcript_24780/g.41923 Transcript_24780/m.41923 type:complete len:588 (+) Transcript_24780:75-1838(+)|eukprot:CAMPEP_0114414952 /NCGR_PEP_ID=MMETSP0103-20121206/1660_1 /TAXON_ID=37642 ORGANISM="Paraphysomonas imperforata, Strain PA2" /NCGR_SAMPLE_ID=MMETSP0103 /ASSEMBLY_ACC=CAM_ASM_000201 /LENGTH=587 /DNA_ID=CAMNT_0001583123 /DNA_START=101 /DNA_END=1864 /DNA_ORIENTATION=-